jgi:lysophospholipid acyltransferase (LPLAT)-like uncharacterized protein
MNNAIKLLKQGGALCITPDGPRGPRQRVGRGPIVIARRGNAAILPYALATAPSKRLSSWDRFQIPLPFARGAIVFGDVIDARETDDVASMQHCLETRLNAATRRAEELCGAPHIAPAPTHQPQAADAV